MVIWGSQFTRTTLFSNRRGKPVLSAYTFASNTALFESAKEETKEHCTWRDRVSSSGPLALQSDALPTALAAWLILLKSKQCRLWSDCSFGTSLIWVFTVCSGACVSLFSVSYLVPFFFLRCHHIVDGSHHNVTLNIGGLKNKKSLN